VCAKTRSVCLVWFCFIYIVLTMNNGFQNNTVFSSLSICVF
jgi:hypothetical protein